MFEVGWDVLPAVTVDRISHDLYFPTFAGWYIGDYRIFFVDFEVFSFGCLNQPDFTFSAGDQLIGRTGECQTSLIEKCHVRTRTRNVAHNVSRKNDDDILSRHG